MQSMGYNKRYPSIKQSEFSGVKIDRIGLRRNGYELYGQMSPHLQLKDLDIGVQGLLA